ncbi:GNAT family N-acetyltransferase [Psychrobacillus sp. INOP01]|uniref:GNAT family N-acetyltransferase n=1 Tax=Psychrobacillus sp. INOP01 TaxID=2829187 RepID=UPI001BAC25C9|nr:GNAT family N-acetyltransferase [Psychrobacillus sp. INOP01]QUG41953.1 GNAT family N-acetyltransferase [Psychrobacillus sp. INOP01]
MDILKIERLYTIEDYLEELSELLIKTVEDGASIGFLSPMESLVALNYWKTVLSPEVTLLVAKSNNKIVGSVQLHLSTKQNGSHRAEIAKLMTHPKYRRSGIGRLLMQKSEEIARNEGRSLIVLDTREGDPSNFLYTSLGYSRAGRIPDYAKSVNGELAATIFYYKNH